ncbi:DUF4401 domain-containing protein [Klebsiella sp. BIGb0407]|uniref:DUF4401 domain-containing protein n=1 Tax=Klebsiella sp. BIGb0407 TaxID=2940603 RepID=UPI00216A7020|nr:DUF4401 domain-containing protein [Klebsiella sp. BIGb0407]MCS3431604.1 putative membrane protein [Klebsiella sp. BIGb0407]
MDLSPHQQDAMPSGAAERLCHSLSSLIGSSTEQNHRLSPTAYQQILYYCGVRPSLTGWRSFLTLVLTLLGLLALVTGTVFFIAWNWAEMPKMTKFLLAQLFIIALAVIVWWRWYDAVARMALLAVGLSFGGLFALYGQVYQTGADSWELFFTWACVLFPLALLGRQNALWFCTWVIANLAFQLYYISQSERFFADIAPSFLSWLPASILYGYLIVQTSLLLMREAFAEYATRNSPSSWLASRWCSRFMAAYLLLTFTSLITESVWDESVSSLVPFMFMAVVLAVGYYYYRYHRPDLCMLTFGVISLVTVGCVLIIRFVSFWDIGTLFMSGLLMVFLLIAGGALLLHWRRKMPVLGTTKRSLSDEETLLQELYQRRLLTDVQVAEITKFDHSAHLPWYLRGALALGCWVAGLISLCLLGLLLYVTDLLDETAEISLIVASLMVAVPAGMMLRTGHTGKRHIGLAWAIAATIGLCIGVYLLAEPFWSHEDFIGTLWCLPVIALMAVAMPDRLYRILAVAALVFLFIPTSTALIITLLPVKLTWVIMALLVAGIVVLWLWALTRPEKTSTGTHQQLISALLYGIPVGLGIQSFASMPSDILGEIFWGYSFNNGFPLILGSGVAVGLIASALVYALAFKASARIIYLPAAIVCGTIAIFAPGIGLGLIFLLAARYLGSKGLLACTGCFLMWYLMNWYYFLDVTLLYKSLLLFASGVLLLCLAWVAKQLLPAVTGDVHEN